MKFTTILFSLAVVATTTTDHYGVHGMSDDMENTTDTNASASSDEGFVTYCDSLEESLGDTKTGSRCIKDSEKIYKNLALSEAYFNWINSLQVDEGLSTEGGNSSYSYTSSYSDETTAAYKEACEKGEGNTFTQIPDRSFQCRVEGESTNATVAVTNNANCFPSSKNCDSTMTDFNLTATDFANDHLYISLKIELQEVDCTTMKMDTYESGDEDGSGGVVTSTHVIGSLVAATAVIAFTVLI